MLERKIKIYTLYELLFYFLMYSVLGWAFETIYTFLYYGVWVYRGFLYSPLCPVYGIVMISAIFLLEPIRKKIVTLYIGSVILITIIEYLTGALLLAVFNRRWWNYSDELFHLNGHVTLFISLWWGLGLMIIILFAHPMIVSLVKKIPVSKGRLILIFSYLILFIDTVFSIVNEFVKRFLKS